MAILETAASHRTRLLEDFYRFRRDVVTGKHLSGHDDRIYLCGNIEDRVPWLPAARPEMADDAAASILPGTYTDSDKGHERLTLRSGQYRSVLLPPSPNEFRRRNVARILASQGIEIGITQAALKRPNAKSSIGQARGNEPFPAGTFVIDLHQPLGALAASLLDPVPAVEESTLLAERRSLVGNDRSILSQYSAWSLPLWSNVEAWYERRHVKASPLSEGLSDGGPTESMEHGLKEQLAEQWATSHAFLLNAADDATLAATLRLLESGIILRAAAVEFGTHGMSFAPGTIMVPARDGNDSETVIEHCLNAEVTPIPVDLALTDYGTDLGSREVVSVKMPRIALLTGFGTSSMALGRLWFMFDKEMEWPVSLLPIQGISGADLTAYNVIILPDAPKERGRRLREIIGSESWDRILNWASFGGTLVLCGESIAALPQVEDEPPAHFAIRRELLEQMHQLERQTADDLYSAGLLEGPSARYRKPEWLNPALALPEEAAAWDARARRYSPRGVFLRLKVDTDDWLTAGVRDNACIPIDTKQAYHALYPAETIARFERGADLCAAGLLWPEAGRRWEASAALMREKIGSGQLIGIAGDFKHGSPVLDRLVLNAAMFGPTFVDH
jgi:hypothetical protein